MHRTRTISITAMIAATAIALTACGGDDAGGDGTASAEAIAAAFVEQGAPEDEATCVAEQIEGTLSLDDVEAFVAATDPEDVDTDVLEAIGTALGACTG